MGNLVWQPRVGRVHVILDRFDRHRPLDLADAALRGGADVLQLRATHLSDRERYELAGPLLTRCRDAGAALIVDDRVDIAAALGADGVHLGAHDLPVGAARALLGSDALVGATARDAATGVAREREGASYLGVGPTFATTSKSGLPDPIGTDGVGAVARAVSVPVVAIGGITAPAVPEVLGSGAHGVALIGAVAGADDPQAAVAAVHLVVSRDVAPDGAAS